MDDTERMRILLTAMPEPGHQETRETEKGDKLRCLAHHFKGAGLLEIEHLDGNKLARVFRLSMTGQPLGIFEHDREGCEKLVFDQTARIGDYQAAEIATLDVLRLLGSTLTPDEENAYYL